MLWTMYYLLEFVLISAALFPLVHFASGAGECLRYIGGRKLTCYDCDSRYDVTCVDPFNRTAPPEMKPPIRECFGCCLKIIHKFPKDHKRRGGESWVQRTCTENIIINYFMVDHVCMSEGKGHGKMCFCESDLCNGVGGVSPLGLLMALSMVILSRIAS